MEQPGVTEAWQELVPFSRLATACAFFPGIAVACGSPSPRTIGEAAGSAAYGSPGGPGLQMPPGTCSGLCCKESTSPVAERHVKVFRNGRNQAIRIPREFELPGEDAIMRKEGDRLIIEPAPKRSLIELLDTWDPIDEEFPTIEDRPPEPVEL